MFDVVVIGGGIAGSVAAVRASELGLSVALLEAGKETDYMCNSRITGGVFHVGVQNILAEPEVAAGYIRAATEGYSQPELAETLALNARRGVEWLKTQGLRFIKGGPTPDLNAVLAPPKLAQFGTHWKGRGGDVLLRTLGEKLVARGGVIHLGCRARDLRIENGRCVGVTATLDDETVEFDAGAVVIADGGYQANEDLLRRGISAAPGKLLQRNAGTGRGDGLLMAEKAGAKLVELTSFYGHLNHRDALKNDRLWPYPMIDMLAVSGIAVDASGNRFADEGMGGVYLANAVARLPDPQGAWAVFDEAVWNGPGRTGVLAPNACLELAGGALLSARSITELANQMAVDPQQLQSTVDAFNAALEGGQLASLAPARSSHKFTAFPLKKAPFYAVPVCAGITYTLGGIATDGNAQALREDGQAFPGLYAAGACTGGLEGGPAVGYTGGLSKSCAFGLIAAESIAAQLPSA
ncbi:FAD-dependent oxidoreductase [Paraburkholderia phymatum]|uniref:FAD-dependent oxidoreductase n=1 Tax=Paraburkholderia phymatum TaxID=148447 RepID=UPI003176633A